MYDEADFERRFRVPRSVFLRIYHAVKDHPFFAQRINATGRPQAHPSQKVVAAFRVIYYGAAPDRTDEYVRLSASTIAMSVREILRFIVDEFGPACLRPPTPSELERILERNAQRGWPWRMGSLDCSHWDWSNWPKAFAGMYHNRNGKRTVVMETVCDEELWIWHLFVGCPGSQNDLNAMHASPLYLSVTEGEWPPRTFSYTANGTTRTLLYYLVDGIYPPFAFFVSPFSDSTTGVETTFNRLQEALRKDVERLYAVLTSRLHIALHPIRYANVESMVTVANAVAILHNMLTEKRRGRYVSRTRVAAAAQAAAELDADGDVSGGGAVGGGGEGVRNGAAETPAAAGSAAGGTAGGGVAGAGDGETGLLGDVGGCAAGNDEASVGASAGGAGRTRLTPDGVGGAAGVGGAGGGAGGEGDGVTGFMAAGVGGAAGIGGAGGGAGAGSGGGPGFMGDGGGGAAGIGAAGGGAVEGGGGGTAVMGDVGGGAAGIDAAGGGGGGGGGGGTAVLSLGSGAAGGGTQSNANSYGGSYGSYAGGAAPVIAPAGALPAGSFGHSRNAWAVARDEEEHERLIHDLSEHVWVQRSMLFAPYR